MHIFDIIWLAFAYSIGVRVAAWFMWDKVLESMIRAMKHGSKTDQVKAMLPLLMLGMYAGPQWAILISQVIKDCVIEIPQKDAAH